MTEKETVTAREDQPGDIPQCRLCGKPSPIGDPCEACKDKEATILCGICQKPETNYGHSNVSAPYTHKFKPPEDQPRQNVCPACKSESWRVRKVPCSQSNPHTFHIEPKVRPEDQPCLEICLEPIPCGKTRDHAIHDPAEGSHPFRAASEAQGEAPQLCIHSVPTPGCRRCAAQYPDLVSARIETGAHPSQDALQLIRGIVRASIELACLRNDLCYEDSPPMVVEEVAEIVDDTFNALQGIDCCDESPCPEWTAIMQALAGARSTPSPPPQEAYNNLNVDRYHEIQDLQREVERLREALRVREEAILWALGENGEFNPPNTRRTLNAIPKPYWWRSELRQRAALGRNPSSSEVGTESE